jgi:hypothetical protein
LLFTIIDIFERILKYRENLFAKLLTRYDHYVEFSFAGVATITGLPDLARLGQIYRG